MASQPHSSSTDLDSTNELPPLDLAAYEANLAEQQQSCSRTDTWAVAALQDISELSDATATPTPRVTALRGNKASFEGTTLTVNVERILKRISDLEADIVTAHEANGALQRRVDAMQLERDQQTQRIDALTAENARLAEQCVLAQEMVQRSEQQLRERNRADEERLQRTQSALAAAEKALTDEKASTAQLSRRLAVKLTDYDKLQALFDARNRAVDELSREREALERRVQEHDDSRTGLEAKLAATEQSVAEQRGLVLERDRALTQVTRDRELLATQLDELGKALQSEREAAQAEIQALTDERDVLLPAADELAARDAELERAHAAIIEIQTQLQAEQHEHATLASLLERARARVKTLSQEIFSRDHQIAELQEELAVHDEALAAIRHDVGRLSDEAPPSRAVERFLEPVDHEGPLILLTAKLLTVGRTIENDVCLPSKLISRHHARLLVGPTGVIVEDAGSTNGCFVNGEQVRQHLMHDGDFLELGELRYRLCIRPVGENAAPVNVAEPVATPTE